MKKLLISFAFAALAFGSVAHSADWTQTALNDHSAVLTGGAINNAQVKSSAGSQVGIQSAGASAGSSLTTYGASGPVAQGATTANAASNKSSLIVTVGLVNNAQVQKSQGSAVVIAGTGASASHSVTQYNK